MANDNYRWRDAKGRYHALADMEDTYVFNVWVMLWDTLVPECRLRDNGKVWVFNPAYYTTEYLVTSERIMYLELWKRGKYLGVVDQADDWCKSRDMGDLNDSPHAGRPGGTVSHLDWLSENIWCWHALATNANKPHNRWAALQATLQILATTPDAYKRIRRRE